MRLKPGTVMIGVPTTGAAADECFVCTGPESEPGHEREMAGDALVLGIVIGVRALREQRPPFCVAHETRFRQILAEAGIHDEITLRKLGVEYKIATGEEEVGQ